MSLAPGTRIGSFEVVGPLCAGGMGEVYRAVDHRLARTVALKVVPAAVADDAERLQRFEREAKTVAELSHPNILGIFDFGRDGAVVYAALEYVDGSTLRELLADGPLPARKAIDIGRQVARGLAAAHAAGILHRDVKPENVIVTPTGHVKLLDFGIARRLPSDTDKTASLTELTGTGHVLGTSGYMAPEQVRGLELDQRSDVFAAGVVLYEMLAGRAPFAAEDRAETLARILRDDPAPLDAAIPPALRRVVERCLEKSPAERFQSAADLAFTLEALGSPDGGVVTSPTVAPAPGRPRRRWLAAAVVTAAAAGLLATSGRWWPGSSPVGGSASFERVTYRRGTVFEARFAALGQVVVYGAAWEGSPAEVFDTQIGNRDGRTRSLAPAFPVAVSSSGDLAILQNPAMPLRHWRAGRLAVAAASGAPRVLAEGVSTADWSPDGRELAIARTERPNGPVRIEWPVGQVIAERRRVTNLRVSRDGSRLAWLDSDTDTSGADVMVWERASGVRRLGLAGQTPGGLAWSADGREIWYTGARSATLGDFEVRAVSLDGVTRTVLALPGGARLHDVSPRGDLLVAQSHESMELRVDDGTTIHDLSWFASTFARDISNDGRLVLFTEDGPRGFDLFVRTLNRSPATRIAEGLDGARAKLSPDGRMVAIGNAALPRLTIVPVEVGDRREIEAQGGIIQGWLPDSQHVLVWGPQSYGRHPAIVPIDGRTTVRIVDALTCDAAPILSVTGREIACRVGSAVAVHEVGGRTTTVTPKGPLGDLVTWAADGQRLFMNTTGVLPQAITALDLQSGTVSVVREVKLPDATGAWRIRPVYITPDGRTLAYTVARQLDDLYVYRGVR